MHNKIINIKQLLVLLGLCGVLLQGPAQAAPFGSSERPFMKKDQSYKRLMGITAGVGSIETDETEQGALLYANLYLLWFNLSAEYQSFDNRSITNTYTGVGMGRYFQLQYGYGEEGYLLRARTELEVIGKFTVFLARERYREKPEYDNYSIGIGYNF